MTAMPYFAQPSLLPRYFPLFDPQPNRPRVEYMRSNGAMLDPDELPREARQVSVHKNIPDVVMMAGSWCVSQPFKNLVEAREPGTHAFYPLPLFRRDGSQLPPYYLFDIRQQIDAVIVEKSKISWWDTDGFKIMCVGDHADLMLDPAMIHGRHVWRGKTHLSNDVFFSDDLAKAVLNAKLIKLRLVKTREYLP
jgi:hypothetical protein